jgi:hypothetical protein
LSMGSGKHILEDQTGAAWFCSSSSRQYRGLEQVGIDLHVYPFMARHKNG